MTPSQQLAEIDKKVRTLLNQQQACWIDLISDLKLEKIEILKPVELTESEKEFLHDEFINNTDIIFTSDKN